MSLSNKKRKKKKLKLTSGQRLALFFLFFPLRLQEAFIILIGSNIMNAGVISFTCSDFSLFNNTELNTKQKKEGHV